MQVLVVQLGPCTWCAMILAIDPLEFGPTFHRYVLHRDTVWLVYTPVLRQTAPPGNPAA